MLFAAIYVPDLPVEAIVRTQPELREQAIAVVEGNPPLQMVIAMNDAARQMGVEPDMTRLQAQGRGVEARLRSPAQERTLHAALLDCAQSFSPRVEDTAADTIVLDLDGLDRLFGPPAKIARDLARRVSEVGVEANVGVASNPDAAVHAARGFPGVTVITPGKEADRLGGLPVDVLALSPEMLETLDRWGIRNFRALAALPEIAITERLGQEGLRFQRLARGTLARDIVVAEPALHFEETVELEHPVELLEPLAFLLGRLLEQLCARLGARALATNELRLTLMLESLEEENPPRRHGDTEKNKKEETDPSVTPCLRGGSPSQRTLRLPVPMLDSRVFLKLLQLDLKAHPPQAPVRKIALAAEPVRPRMAQAGLFLPLAPEPERLELTLARIQGVVGEGRVGAAELVDTHRPDGFRMTKFAVKEPGLKPRLKKAALTARLKPCPSEGNHDSPAQPRAAVPQTTLALRLFRPAVRVMVEVRGGRPVRVNGEIRGEVVECSGPWRSSGEWWRESKSHHRGTESTEKTLGPQVHTDSEGIRTGPERTAAGGWEREEWDVALAASRVQGEAVALYRVFREMSTGHWFVAGSYD